MTKIRKTAALCCAVFVSFVLLAVPASSQQNCIVERLAVQNEGLTLVALLITPAANREGGFPLIVWSYGARRPESQPYITPGQACNILVTRHGFAILVPERRGYGGSEGLPYFQFRGNAMERLWEETRDVLATTDEVIATKSRIDRARIVGAGASIGGAIAIFAAASRPDLFRGVIAQAPGWEANEPHHLYYAMIDAMRENARNFPGPVLLQHHPLDITVTIAYSRTVYQWLVAEGRTNVFLKESAVPANELPLRGTKPDGHLIFGLTARGERYFRYWGPEFLAFITVYAFSN